MLQTKQQGHHCCKVLGTIKQLAIVESKLLEVRPSSPLHTCEAITRLQLQVQATAAEADELHIIEQLPETENARYSRPQLQAAHMLTVP